jgi:diacylglycerol kinase family enzyme
VTDASGTRRRVDVFVNEAAGSVDDIARQSEDIRSAFAAAGVDARVEPVDPARLAESIAARWGRGECDAIVVAGGDGTISCAAGAAVESGAVLGVLPMGTFNHFAKDLGIPGDLRGAAAALAVATVEEVDVAEVNGRVFVNNAALGVYPEMVETRDDIRERRGWGKIRAVPVAMVRTLRRMPSHNLVITADDTPRLAVSTSFVFVGNGLFDEGGGGVGSRPSLTTARLGFYVIKTTSRWRLFRDAVRARLGGLGAARQIDRRSATGLIIESDESSVSIALDGEPLTLDSPLQFRARPGALRVLRPVPPAEEPDVPTVAR